MAPGVLGSTLIASSTGATTVSGDFVCPSGTTKLLFLVMWYDTVTSGAPTVSSATYNSVGLTSKGRAAINFAGDDYVTCEILYLDSPTTGSSLSASVTLSSALSVNEIIRLIPVALSSAGGFGANTGSGTGNSAAPSVTFVTESATGLIVSGVALQVGSAGSPGDGVSELQDAGASSGGGAWAGTKPATGGSDTINASISSTRWAMFAVEVLEAAAGGRTTKNTDAYELGVGAGISRRIKT